MNYIKETLSILFLFKGRINRGKFWRAYLFITLVILIIGLSFGAKGFLSIVKHDEDCKQAQESGAYTGDCNNYPMTTVEENQHFNAQKGITTIFIAIFLIWSGLAVGAKRFRDFNQTGVWVLLYFVPILGHVLWLFLGIKRGTKGPNKYGPDPLEIKTINA